MLWTGSGGIFRRHIRTICTVHISPRLLPDTQNTLAVLASNLSVIEKRPSCLGSRSAVTFVYQAVSCDHSSELLRTHRSGEDGSAQRSGDNDVNQALAINSNPNEGVVVLIMSGHSRPVRPLKSACNVEQPSVRFPVRVCDVSYFAYARSRCDKLLQRYGRKSVTLKVLSG